MGREATRLMTIADHPYYSTGTIPAGSYPGVDVDLPTLLMMNWIVVREDLSPEVVQALLDVLGDPANLSSVHPVAEQVDPSLLRQAPIPVHAAAEAWISAR